MRSASRLFPRSSSAELAERQYDALEKLRPDYIATQQDAYSMDPRSKVALDWAEEDKIKRQAASSLRSSRIVANTIHQTCVDDLIILTVPHLPMRDSKELGRPLLCNVTRCAR
jgi:hypothetical protein